MSLNVDKLTHVEVSELWNKRQEIFKQDKVDLLNIKQVDSAGVAFLVQWAKSLPQHKLTLIHSTHNVRSLIKTFRLAPLFELQDNL